jgi:hypothetical protein
MGGGPRNPEHIARAKAQNKARKAANKLLPPPKPKPPKVVSTKMYDALGEWKDKPISTKIANIAPHIHDFIKDMWLKAYPLGSNLRKLQRDIAFRMERKYRPGKLPYQVIMPIVGKLEREGYLKTRVSSTGKCLIYCDPDCKQDENSITTYLDTSRSQDWVLKETDTATPETTTSVVSKPPKQPYKPKFTKQQKPKVHKQKKRRVNGSEKMAPGKPLHAAG